MRKTSTRRSAQLLVPETRVSGGGPFFPPFRLLSWVANALRSPVRNSSRYRTQPDWFLRNGRNAGAGTILPPFGTAPAGQSSAGLCPGHGRAESRLPGRSPATPPRLRWSFPGTPHKEPRCHADDQQIVGHPEATRHGKHISRGMSQ